MEMMRVEVNYGRGVLSVNSRDLTDRNVSLCLC